MFQKNSVSMSKTIKFKAIQFSIDTQYNCQKRFYFKIFSLVKEGLTHLQRCSQCWFVEFYGISNFAGYLTPNPFLYK